MQESVRKLYIAEKYHVRCRSHFYDSIEANVILYVEIIF